MGAFKPLLAFGPKTIIETCIDNLRGGGVEAVVVVLGQGPHADKLKLHLMNAGVVFATNTDPESQMSASIASGVRALPEGIQAVIINPADHAAVPSGVVATLISEWKLGARMVIPTWNDRGGHPVLVDISFRDELLSLNPNGGLKTFFTERQDQVKRVAVKSNYIARDMDTWDDYRALHQEVFGFPAPETPRERDQKEPAPDAK
jgi:molybdenum cofactor cytidylyltransferase